LQVRLVHKFLVTSHIPDGLKLLREVKALASREGGGNHGADAWKWSAVQRSITAEKHTRRSQVLQMASSNQRVRRKKQSRR